MWNTASLSRKCSLGNTGQSMASGLALNPIQAYSLEWILFWVKTFHNHRSRLRAPHTWTLFTGSHSCKKPVRVPDLELSNAVEQFCEYQFSLLLWKLSRGGTLCSEVSWHPSVKCSPGFQLHLICVSVGPSLPSLVLCWKGDWKGS